MDSFYNYEVGFVAIWQDSGRQIFQDNMGALSEDKRKNLTALGHVTINNDHRFSKGWDA